MRWRLAGRRAALLLRTILFSRLLGPDLFHFPHVFVFHALNMPQIGALRRELLIRAGREEYGSSTQK
jgi:hypothetical protein